MSLLEDAKSLLRSRRIRPKKLLGQSFMIESSIFPCLTLYASLNNNDTVLDVGAGLGFLTRFMAGKCRTVLAVEADVELAKVLREQLADVSNAQVIEGDVLEARIPSFNKVVSIPPYYISSRLLLWLFNRGFDRAVLVLQKEFANRLTSSVGCEDYGWLTVVAYYHSEISLLDAVPRGMFYPQPEVDSVVVCLKSKNVQLSIGNEAKFRQFMQSMFTNRNRKVGGAVLSYLKNAHDMSREKSAKVIAALPFRDRRVRQLSPEDFGELASVVL
jgi:16S rRNA (adenine1518-N6/adenine1519-N6)-dimethyltransferase